MDKFKAFLNHTQVISVVGVILILSAVLDVTGSSFLFFKLRLPFGLAVVGLYHILTGIVQVLEPDE